MAEWGSHLIVADGVLKRLPMLLRREFFVGNIAPDCNIANADGKTFTPSREITHWMKGERKTSGDARLFHGLCIETREETRAERGNVVSHRLLFPLDHGCRDAADDSGPGTGCGGMEKNWAESAFVRYGAGNEGRLGFCQKADTKRRTDEGLVRF